MLQRHLHLTNKKGKVSAKFCLFCPAMGLSYLDSANRRVKYYSKFAISKYIIKLKLNDYKGERKLIKYYYLHKFPWKLSRFYENQLAVFGISKTAQKCHLTSQSLTVAPSIRPIFIVKSASPINLAFNFPLINSFAIRKMCNILSVCTV